MITYVKGDIFSSPSKIIVNTVNTVGIMGKGVALEFKNRYPDMFQSYKALCDEKNWMLEDWFYGRMHQSGCYCFLLKNIGVILQN